MNGLKGLLFLRPGLLAGLGMVLLTGCQAAPARRVVSYSDMAPRPMPAIPRERPFDGSLYAPGGLADLASDAVANRAGDPVIIRFGPKNGYPGVSQNRVTRLMGQIVREERSGSLLVSAERTVRDGSGTRRLVLVGRISRASIEPDNEIPVSLVSMLRFRYDQPSDGGRSPRFANPATNAPSAKGPGKAAPGAKTQGKKP